jgi:predicted HNH restriction endonuclease
MIPSTPPEGCAGFLSFGSGQLLMDERDSKKPFIGGVSKKKRIRKEKVPTKKIQIKRRLRSEEEISKSLLEEDKSNYADYGAKKKAYIRKIISRNNKAVKDLKDLYQRKCQIIGDKLGFKKKDGTPYCEAHHCIPLGEKGADSPYNIIIVNPLIHRMLHYAEVSEIDLSMISKNNTLDIVINGQTHTIKWHPDHAKIVKKKLFEK